MKNLMRVRTSFCGPISRIDSRTRDEHEEHEERTQERTQRGITREAYEGIAKPKSTTRSVKPIQSPRPVHRANRSSRISRGRLDEP